MTLNNSGFGVFFPIGSFPPDLGCVKIQRLHTLLPGWVVCVIVLFVTEGNFLLPLLSEHFPVGVLVLGGGIPYGTRSLTALQ